MATHIISSQGEAQHSARLIDGRVFDVLFVLVSLWFIGGTYLDAWAHNHVPRLETFFTPWHAVLYSGVMVATLVFTGVIIVNRSRGTTWRAAIPTGYEYALLGIYGMSAVGVGDALWHSFFGIEQNIDAIFSPTHLAGMLCSNLFAAGLYRALSLRRQEFITWRERSWLVIAFVLFLAMLFNNLQPTSPYVWLWPTTARTGQDTEQLLAVTSYMLQAGVLTGLTLYTIRRWRLFPGFFSIALCITAIPLSLMRDHSIAIAIGAGAGFIIDVAYFVLRPTIARPLQLRTFAVITATSLYVVDFLALQLLYGIVWTIHLTIGSIFAIGLLVWLLSYLVLPAQSAASPVERER